MTVIRKDATIANTDTIDTDFPGTFEVILSAPTEDRDGDTLTSDGWELPLPDHITFDMDHGMTVASTVGSGVPRIDDDGRLIVAGSYTALDRGQETRTLVKEGHIKTVSVAFMTKRSGTKGAQIVKRELLNGAFVAIPSNREALVLNSKALARKAGARNSASDAELIQQIHDATILLGASPDVAAAEKRAPRPTVKAVDGSLEATQDRARDALQDYYSGQWVYLQATIPSGDGGTLVFSVENPDTYESETFKQDYLDDGAVITITGDRTAVDLMQVIRPDPDDESEDNAPAGTATDPATGAPAPAAGSKAAPATDEAAAQLRIRTARLRAQHALATSTD